MSIAESFGKKARRLLAASALAAAAACAPSLAHAFGMGAQSGGDESFSYFELEDTMGRPYQVRLPTEDDPAYKDAGLKALTEYVATGKDLTQLADNDAASFLMILGVFGGNVGMSEKDVAGMIGVSPAVYEELQYQQERYRVLGAYESVAGAVYESDSYAANQRLGYNEEDVQKANELIAEAAERYPEDMAFKQWPLSEQELRDIRWNAAWLNIEFVLDLFDRIDSGQADSRMLNSQDTSRLLQIVDLLYRDIQKDPAAAINNWDISRGNKYNSLIPAFMNEELAKRGIDPAVFYKRLVELRNYYDRTSVIEPAPPAIPVYDTEETVAAPAPAP